MVTKSKWKYMPDFGALQNLKPNKKNERNPRPRTVDELAAENRLLKSRTELPVMGPVQGMPLPRMGPEEAAGLPMPFDSVEKRIYDAQNYLDRTPGPGWEPTVPGRPSRSWVQQPKGNIPFLRLFGEKEMVSKDLPGPGRPYSGRQTWKDVGIPQDVPTDLSLREQKESLAARLEQQVQEREKQGQVESERRRFGAQQYKDWQEDERQANIAALMAPVPPLEREQRQAEYEKLNIPFPPQQRDAFIPGPQITSLKSTEDIQKLLDAGQINEREAMQMNSALFLPGTQRVDAAIKDLMTDLSEGRVPNMFKFSIQTALAESSLGKFSRLMEKARENIDGAFGYGFFDGALMAPFFTGMRMMSPLGTIRSPAVALSSTKLGYPALKTTEPVVQALSTIGSAVTRSLGKAAEMFDPQAVKVIPDRIQTLLESLGGATKVSTDYQIALKGGRSKIDWQKLADEFGVDLDDMPRIIDEMSGSALAGKPDELANLIKRVYDQEPGITLVEQQVEYGNALAAIIFRNQYRAAKAAGATNEAATTAATNARAQLQIAGPKKYYVYDDKTGQIKGIKKVGGGAPDPTPEELIKAGHGDPADPLYTSLYKGQSEVEIANQATALGAANLGWDIESQSYIFGSGQGIINNAETGKHLTGTFFRGTGRTDPGEVYTEKFLGMPVLGEAAYTAPNKLIASRFGPNVDELEITLENPLVISTDDQWKALRDEAVWYSTAPMSPDDINRMRYVILDRGHDGVVIRLPELTETMKESNLHDLFTDDQVIAFNVGSVTPVPSVEAPTAGAIQPMFPGALGEGIPGSQGELMPEFAGQPVGETPLFDIDQAQIRADRQAQIKSGQQEFTTPAEAPVTEDITVAPTIGSSITDTFKDKLNAGSIFEGGEVKPGLGYSWRSMGGSEYEKLITGQSFGGPAKRGSYWSWYPGYSANMTSTSKKPKYLVEVEIPSKWEGLTRTGTLDDVRAVWKSVNKGPWISEPFPREAPTAATTIAVPEAVPSTTPDDLGLVKKGKFYYPKDRFGNANLTDNPIHKVTIGGRERYLSSVDTESGSGKDWYEYFDENSWKDTLIAGDPMAKGRVKRPTGSTKKELIEQLEAEDVTPAAIDPDEMLKLPEQPADVTELQKQQSPWKYPSIETIGGVLEQGGKINRYWSHMPPSHKTLGTLPPTEEGGIQAYNALRDKPSKREEYFAVLDKLKIGPGKQFATKDDVNLIWLSPHIEQGANVYIVDASKLNLFNVGEEAAGKIHIGNIPPEAIVKRPAGLEAPTAAPVTPGEPPVEAATAGFQTEATGNSGKLYRFQLELVEADELISKVSHNPESFEPTAGYPEDLQPRERGAIAQQADIRKMASNLQPNLLMDSPTLTEGAPIVGPADGWVEAGNGRAMAIIRAKNEHPDKYASYKAALEQNADRLGLTKADITNMTNPVLVRKRLLSMDDATRKMFIDEANVAGTRTYSPYEQARTDADYISIEDVSALQIGDKQRLIEALKREVNVPVVGAFLNRLPTAQQQGLLADKGEASPELLQRFYRAALAKTFPGENGQKLVSAITMDVEHPLANLYDAIERSLGSILRSEAKVQGGIHSGDLAISEDIAAAINKMAELKLNSPNKAIKELVDDFINQQSLLKRDLSPFQEQVMKTFARDEFIRAPAKMGLILNNFANTIADLPAKSQLGFMAEGPTKKVYWETAEAQASDKEIIRDEKPVEILSEDQRAQQVAAQEQRLAEQEAEAAQKIQEAAETRVREQLAVGKPLDVTQMSAEEISALTQQLSSRGIITEQTNDTVYSLPPEQLQEFGQSLRNLKSLKNISSEKVNQLVDSARSIPPKSEANKIITEEPTGLVPEPEPELTERFGTIQNIAKTNILDVQLVNPKYVSKALNRIEEIAKNEQTLTLIAGDRSEILRLVGEGKDALSQLVKYKSPRKTRPFEKARADIREIGKKISEAKFTIRRASKEEQYNAPVRPEESLMIMPPTALAIPYPRPETAWGRIMRDLKNADQVARQGIARTLRESEREVFALNSGVARLYAIKFAGRDLTIRLPGGEELRPDPGKIAEDISLRAYWPPERTPGPAGSGPPPRDPGKNPGTDPGWEDNGPTHMEHETDTYIAQFNGPYAMELASAMVDQNRGLGAIQTIADWLSLTERKFGLRVGTLPDPFRFMAPGLSYSLQTRKAFVGQTAANSFVQTYQNPSLKGFLEQLKEAFGEDVLHGAVANVQYNPTKTSKKPPGPHVGMLIDILVRPSEYVLTPRQKEVIAIGKRREEVLNNWVNTAFVPKGYERWEISEYIPEEYPDGMYIPQVETKSSADVAISTQEAYMKGRGYHRIHATWQDRYEATSEKLNPETNVELLMLSHDAWRAHRAGQVTFIANTEGLTRMQLAERFKPQVYENIKDLTRNLNNLNQIMKRLEIKRSNNIMEMISGVGDASDTAGAITDLEELRDYILMKVVPRVKQGQYKGLDPDEIKALIKTTQKQLKTYRTEIAGSKLGNWKEVPTTRRYYSPEEVDGKMSEYEAVSQLIKAGNNKMVQFISGVRNVALNLDLSPLWGVHGHMAFLADPVGFTKFLVRTFSESVREGKNPLSNWSQEGLARKIRENPSSWAEFAATQGRIDLGSTDIEFSGGLLKKIPYYKKTNEGFFAFVTDASHSIFERTRNSLEKNGASHLDAVVAAGDMVSKAVPLFNPALLGQSPQRTGFLRGVWISSAFVTKPAELIADAMRAYAKILLKRKLTGKERIAAGMVLNIALLTTLVSVVSAAWSYHSRGEDPVVGIKRALGWSRTRSGRPYPEWLALNLPNGSNYSIGGPFKAVIRAITPQRVADSDYYVPFAGIVDFMYNKVSPALRANLDLFRNKDFYDNKIRSGEFPSQFFQTVMYELEGGAPLFTRPVLSALRSGTPDWSAVGVDSVNQVLGFNYNSASPWKKLNNELFAWADKNIDYDISTLGDLETRDKIKFRTDNPEIYEDIKIAYEAEALKGNQQAARQVMKIQEYENQLIRDEGLKAGTLHGEEYTPRQWVNNMWASVQRGVGATELYNKTVDPKYPPPDNPNEQALHDWYNIMDTFTLPGNQFDGDGWEEAQSELFNNWTPDQQRYVRNHVHPNATAKVLEYHMAYDYLQKYYYPIGEDSPDVIKARQRRNVSVDPIINAIRHHWSGTAPQSISYSVAELELLYQRAFVEGRLEEIEKYIEDLENRTGKDIRKIEVEPDKVLVPQ